MLELAASAWGGACEEMPIFVVAGSLLQASLRPPHWPDALATRLNSCPPPQVMDTPRPEQVRTAQPEAPEATDEDTLELMEMILGALGRDALGLGSSIAHPKESDEWKGMTVGGGRLAGWRAGRDVALKLTCCAGAV